VQTIYFTVASDIKKEYYLAILLDRAASRPVIVASTEGGVEIEKVAHDTPEKIFKVIVDPAYGLADFQVRELVSRLGLAGAEAKNAAKLIRALYAMYWETDAAMVEVNPLITTPPATSWPSTPRSPSTTTPSSATRRSSRCAT
jgi:succinyl-CoA synthetase beta subunit